MIAVVDNDVVVGDAIGVVAAEFAVDVCLTPDTLPTDATRSEPTCLLSQQAEVFVKYVQIWQFGSVWHVRQHKLGETK